MSRKFIAVFFSLNIFLVGGVYSSSTTFAEEDTVVTVVNGVHYTEAQLRKSMQHILNNPQANFEQLYPMLLEQFIVERMVAQSALKKGYDKDERVKADMKRALESIMNNYYVSDFLDEVITDEMIADEYKHAIETIPSSEEIQASHILVETEQEAKDLILKLNGGDNFVDLAKEHSIGPSGANGGSLGYFPKGQMVPEFEKAAFALKVGEYTPQAVKTQFGYHLILLQDRRQRPKPTLAEMRAELHEKLSRTQAEVFINQLKESAEIERYDVKGNKIEEFPRTTSQP